MLLIKINRNSLLLFLIAIVICSLGVNILSISENEKLEQRYRSAANIIKEFDGAGLVAFLTGADSLAQIHENVEIFDIEQGKVIREVRPGPEIRREAEAFLKGITGMYPKVKAFPKKGYIIRIPFNPQVNVESKWLNGYGINSVDQIFILLPSQGLPYLMVLDPNQRPLFFNFQGDTSKLLSELNFQP